MTQSENCDQLGRKLVALAILLLNIYHSCSIMLEHGAILIKDKQTLLISYTLTQLLTGRICRRVLIGLVQVIWTCQSEH